MEKEEDEVDRQNNKSHVIFKKVIKVCNRRTNHRQKKKEK
jgi:hypothetical protein